MQFLTFTGYFVLMVNAMVSMWVYMGLKINCDHCNKDEKQPY